jgi:hypothetical protein
MPVRTSNAAPFQICSGQLDRPALPVRVDRREDPALHAEVRMLHVRALEAPHYQNFIDAIRAGDPKLLTSNITDGHRSSTLPHLANISYRVGRALVFDPKREIRS